MTFRSTTEDQLLARVLSEAAEAERPAWEAMLALLPNGPILEVGCGNGELLKVVAGSRGADPVVGLDTSRHMLTEARGLTRHVPNVLLAIGDAVDPPFPDATFSGIVMNKVVHEIWAVHGRPGVARAFRRARELLIPGGALVIRENTRPEPRPVGLTLSTPERRRQFWRFTAQFQPRAVAAQWRDGDSVLLDIGDALEFLTKADDPAWAAEMMEPHLTFFHDEWGETLAEAGFGRIEIIEDRWTPVPPPLDGAQLDCEIPRIKTVIGASVDS